MTDTPASEARRVRLRHVWRVLTLQRRLAKAQAKREFRAAVAALTPDDVAIDLGANVGRFTRPMAERGAQVYAFEPDPHAFGLLQVAMRGYPNVTLIAAAAGDAEGTITLHRHADFAAAPDSRTKSSSIIAAKANVAGGQGVPVRLVDFPRFVAGLNRDVALLKIDIEGAEVPLMEALLAHPVAARIARIFVETHERGIPQLARRTDALRAASRGLAQPRVNWNWH
ncbi:FkbM family methyltransferase [Fertoebacter nigrum]|uniref:FkbM family methyltransferase n=1 Tax=Fertoeibacter niger TaxID=2656921 RepID=A0A8X8H0Z6_9RHOB|nr:FkbM family methyltransferase [Fertoeibacter niger]NUB45146.1 FkbM family methyltransferase [Fertoeibacter niger]